MRTLRLQLKPKARKGRAGTRGLLCRRIPRQILRLRLRQRPRRTSGQKQAQHVKPRCVVAVIGPVNQLLDLRRHLLIARVKGIRQHFIFHGNKHHDIGADAATVIVGDKFQILAFTKPIYLAIGMVTGEKARFFQ